MSGQSRTTVFFILPLLLITAETARAHHPSAGFGAGSAGPVTTIPAIPLPANRWSIGLRGDYLKFDSFSDAELMRFAAEGKEVHSLEDQRSLFLSAAYGLSDDLSVGLHLPYVIRRAIREGHLDGAGTPEIHDHGDSEGIGDLSLVGQYRFLRRESAGSDVALLLGLKMPTGRTRETDRTGERFATEFQPGSGSWDPLIGLAASRRRESVSLDASVLYAVATNGSQETNLGDMLHFGTALSCRIVPAHHGSHEARAAPGAGARNAHSHLAWDFILEAVGEWRRKQTVRGIRDDDSGGTLILLAPGVRMDVHERWGAYLSVGIPLLQELNGTQHETRYRVILGINAGL